MILMAAYILRKNGRIFLLLALISWHTLVTLTDSVTGCNDAKVQIDMHNATSSGNLTSPNYPDWAPRNSTCSWELNCPVGRLIKLYFYELMFNNSNESQGYLEIRDGATTISPLIIKYTAESNPLATNLSNSGPIVYSSGNYLSLYFKMDSSERFHVWYSSTKPGKTCSPNNTNDENNNIILKPPSWFTLREDLPSKVDCTWKIHSAMGSFVKLMVYNISNDLFCKTGNAYIFNGPYGSASELKHNLCQEQVGISSSPLVYFSKLGLSFQIKTSNSSSVPQLKVNVLLTENNDGCGVEYHIPISRFYTTDYGKGFLPKMLCKRKIKSSSGKHLRLKFLKIDLPSTNECSNSSVQVFEEQEFNKKLTLRAKICGSVRVVPDIIIYSGHALIVVQSEASSRKWEVFANFDSIDPENKRSVCSQFNDVKQNAEIKLTERSGDLASHPNIYHPYPPGIVCKWMVQPYTMAEKDQIEVTFDYFDFKYGNDEKCDQDYVEIDFNEDVQRYCKSTGPPSIIYSGDARQIIITFVSTPLYTSNKGFIAHYNVKFTPPSRPLSWAVTGVLIASGVLLLTLTAFCVYRYKKIKKHKRETRQTNNEIDEQQDPDAVPHEEGLLPSAPPLGPPPPYSGMTDDSPLIQYSTAEQSFPWFSPGSTVTEHGPRERRGDREEESKI